MNLSSIAAALSFVSRMPPRYVWCKVVMYFCLFSFLQMQLQDMDHQEGVGQGEGGGGGGGGGGSELTHQSPGMCRGAKTH